VNQPNEEGQWYGLLLNINKGACLTDIRTKCTMWSSMLTGAKIRQQMQM